MPARTACWTMALGLPWSVSDQIQIHMPLPAIGRTFDVHRAAGTTGGSEDAGTSLAGCHGGGPGGAGGLRGTGQPACAAFRITDGVRECFLATGLWAWCDFGVG